MIRQVILSLLFVFVPIMSSAQNISLDPNMEDIIRTRLQIKVALKLNHLNRLTALNVDKRTLKTFSGLEVARNLVSLRITNCQIEDFNSISVLVNLKELHIRNCRIKDISALSNMSNLSNLSLANNEIEDLTPLYKCSELTWLDIRHNMINSLSALTTLNKLVCLDIRGNPLGSRLVKDEIRSIRIDNPNVDIYLGPDSDVIDPNEIQKRLSAKAAIADFALFAKWHYVYHYPDLPVVSPEVLDAFSLLRSTGDKEYLADVTVLLMRYATDIMASIHTGKILNTRAPHPFVAEFLRVVPRHELIGDELTTTAIVRWVNKNRSTLPPSIVLDVHIRKYLQLQTKLKQRWFEELRKKNGDNKSVEKSIK